jgi:hypothetical protein
MENVTETKLANEIRMLATGSRWWRTLPGGEDYLWNRNGRVLSA